MSISSADTPSLVGSSILRESPPFGASLHTGLGGADLSLSELYISDRSENSPPAPFSLLPHRDSNDREPRHNAEEDADGQGDDQGHEAAEDDATMMAPGKSSLGATRTREERLQHDLFVLKKLNSSFTAYNEALQGTMSSTENVAVQLDRTDRLLDQYVRLLQHTERNSRLIFDESWHGGGTDLDLLEKMRLEAAQKAVREREERERAARLEQERQEREDEERRVREEKEVREKDKRASGSVRGVRGVRGLRTRGSERGASTATRGRLPTTTSAVQVKRGTTSSTVRGIRKS